MKNNIIFIILCFQIQVLCAATLSGIILDKSNGSTLAEASIFVQGEEINVTNGEFSTSLDTSGAIVVKAVHAGYVTEQQSIFIPDNEEEHLFITFTLVKEGDKVKESSTIVPREKAEGLPWKIQCFLIDTKYGLKMKFPGWAKVKHNNADDFMVYNPYFSLTTDEKGTHSIHVEVPGYHTINEVFTLTEAKKELTLYLETTDTANTVKRRQMIITGNRGTIHERTTVGMKSISRKELAETAGAFDDPIRALQTLPSISVASDASARLSVRGGDVLESRYFVDGIPLLQPFHFGGAVSIFNERAIQSLDFYNSGYPAKLHNAQSAIINVNSRKPYLEEDNSRYIHISSLKYNFFRNKKHKEKDHGFTLSATGTWTPLLYKPISKLIQNRVNSKRKQFIEYLVNPVEYHTINFGFGKAINDKWKYNIQNLFNFDKFSYMEVDSPAVVEYTYPDGSKATKTFNNTHNEQNMIKNYPPKPGYIDYHILKRVKVVDTSFHYKQYYNILYGTAQYTPNSENSLDLSAAYQKRWYGIKFPYFENHKYNSNTDIINTSATWYNNSHKKHLLSAGLQFDMNVFKYDVYTMRIWHEVITRGNTNFGDMLGPFAQDSGLIFNMDNISEDLEFFNLNDRMFVGYKGKKRNFQGACFIQDEIHFDDTKMLSLGLRAEGSTLDRDLLLSPRVHYKQQLSSKNEYSISAGLYSQNNYEPDIIALSSKLKPEKCVHFGLGYSHLFREWLKADFDIYGKYYYDLSVELMDIKSSSSKDLDSNFVTSSYYRNDGIGYAFGGEMFLKYDPWEYLFGWLSLSYGHSYRQRQKGWKWHNMPMERPFQLSWNHYFKLPRKYTISCAYKFTSGLPFTDFTLDTTNIEMKIGPYNEKRYDYYKRLDLRLTRGFHKKKRRTEVYLEYINIFNRPNVFLLDKKTKEMKSTALNAPFAAFTWGINIAF